MTATDHNLLESCYKVGDNKFRYNALQYLDDSNATHYTVEFTRTVSNSGINVVIDSVVKNGGGTVSAAATAALTTEVNNLQRSPRSGDECQVLGYTYLGNVASASAAINAAKATGSAFKSIMYQAGHTVFARESTKQFYDQN